MYLPDLTLMIFTFFSFQEIPRSHLKCSSILGSLAKRPREDQLILVSICVSAALTLGLIVFVAVHCRRQMKSCFDPRGLVSIENNTPNNGATNFSWLGFNLFLHTSWKTAFTQWLMIKVGITKQKFQTKFTTFLPIDLLWPQWTLKELHGFFLN